MNWTQRISQAADALRRSQVKIVCVQIGEAMNQDLITMAGSSSLVFAQTDIKGLSGMLFDMSGEMCNNGELENCLVVNCIHLNFNLQF